MTALVLMLHAFLWLGWWAPNGKMLELRVQLSELRNNNGVVQFALYNKEGSIPDEKYKKYYRIGKSTIKNHRATYVFAELPEGTYAVNILHDENENGKIDKGFVLPIEGIGFSNYNKIGLGNRPNFKTASFDLRKDSSVLVKVIYM